MASASGTSGEGPPPKKTAEIKKLMQDKIVSGGAIDRDFLLKFSEVVYESIEGRDNKSQAVWIDDDSSEENNIPDEFICPLTKQLMRDPVIIASGQTFDRPAIMNWRKLGYRTCPVTEEFIFYDAIMPNHLLRGMIKNWCIRHHVPEPVEPLVEEQPTDDDRTHLTSLMRKLLAMRSRKRKEGGKELCRLTNEKPVYRAMYAESPKYIRQLLNVIPLSEYDPQIDPQRHEDIITIVSNILIDERNKKIVAEFHTSIPVLIKSLEADKVEIRCKAAEAIYRMSSLDSNKKLIGNSGALKLLIELLRVKNSLKATEDAIKAISILCENEENAKQAVELGAVFAVTEKFTDNKFIHEMLLILVHLLVDKQACEQMETLDFVSELLKTVKDDNTSDVSKENAILILDNVFESKHGKWKDMVRGAEENRAMIVQISQTGTGLAKIKANTILESLNKGKCNSV